MKETIGNPTGAYTFFLPSEKQGRPNISIIGTVDKVIDGVRENLARRKLSPTDTLILLMKAIAKENFNTVSSSVNHQLRDAFFGDTGLIEEYFQKVVKAKPAIF